MIFWIFLCSPLIVKAKDEFDDFFKFSDDPHPTEVLIDEFAHTIQLANGLSTQLEDKVKESPANNDIETLTVQLNDVTQEMSSVMSGVMIKAMKEASRILKSTRSCQDLAKFGITQSGGYEIDPNGSEQANEIGMYVLSNLKLLAFPCVCMQHCSFLESTRRNVVQAKMFVAFFIIRTRVRFSKKYFSIAFTREDFGFAR